MATFSKRILAGNLVAWQAKVRRRGYPKQSKMFLNRRDAETWAATIESEIGRGVFISRTQAEHTTLKEALDRYEREVTVNKRSAASEKYKIEGWRRSSLADYFLANIHGAQVAEWRDSRLQVAEPTTVVRELRLLSHVFTIARQDWGMEGLHNPVKDTRKPSLVGSERKRRLEQGEEKMLLEKARAYGEPMPSIITIALETAMRRGEIASLRWEMLDMKRRVIHLPMTKNEEARDVPLSTKAIEIFLELPRRIDGWMFGIRGDAITKAFGRICGTTGKQKHIKKSKVSIPLQNLCFHDLRHEATSRLFERGLNQMQVAAITGHKTLQMLKRYTHLRAEDLVKMLG
jgi:integrase